MTYLDVNPMIIALRSSPGDFELKRGWLHHFPSHHEFKFDRDGNVRLHARCDCAMLAVRHEQGRELWETFQLWHASYWRPVEINREFASHFKRPNAVQRLWRRLVASIRRPLLRHLEDRGAAASTSMVPAE
jgi:hypothetical protein